MNAGGPTPSVSFVKAIFLNFLYADFWDWISSNLRNGGTTALRPLPCDWSNNILANSRERKYGGSGVTGRMVSVARFAAIYALTRKKPQ
jgi:hypothetical protein